MIRFRRNPREGTNKIAMVCGKDEFKKSLNRTINIAGKKVKDVMCLPKQLSQQKNDSKFVRFPSSDGEKFVSIP